MCVSKLTILKIRHWSPQTKQQHNHLYLSSLSTIDVWTRPHNIKKTLPHHPKINQHPTSLGKSTHHHPHNTKPSTANHKKAEVAVRSFPPPGFRLVTLQPTCVIHVQSTASFVSYRPGIRPAHSPISPKGQARWAAHRSRGAKGGYYPNKGNGSTVNTSFSRSRGCLPCVVVDLLLAPDLGFCSAFCLSIAGVLNSYFKKKEGREGKVFAVVTILADL